MRGGATATEFETLLLRGREAGACVDPAHGPWRPDLGRGIGSTRWWGELLVLAALVTSALLCWAAPRAIGASAPSRYDSADVAQFRRLAIGSGENTRGGDAPALTGAIALAAVPPRPALELSTETRVGESFAAALARLGVGPGDSARAAELVPAQRIAPGTRLDVVLGSRLAADAARPLQRLTLHPQFDLEVAITRHANAFAVDAGPVAVDSTPIRLRGPVGGNFAQAAAAAGLSADIVQQYLRAIDGNASLAGDLRPDDTYDMVVEHRRSADGASETGKLLLARLDRHGTPLAKLLRWGRDDQFVSALRPSLSSGGSTPLWPVEGRITSGFGLRFHPILGYLRMHSGIDIAARWGTPIRALADGVVSFAGWHGGHGEYVRLAHDGGLATGYGHMSRIAVAEGAHVRAGETIGYVGASGLATGAHLHLEVLRDGRASDPLDWLRGGGFAAGERPDSAAIAGRIARLEALVPTGTVAVR
ncbi:MAG: M23 family metallopeptidase [Novosphingobium sp.]|nr:M23 family metallopeptidase [Novosphingobium sp.]